MSADKMRALGRARPHKKKPLYSFKDKKVSLWNCLHSYARDVKLNGSNDETEVNQYTIYQGSELEADSAMRVGSWDYDAEKKTMVEFSGKSQASENKIKLHTHIQGRQEGGWNSLPSLFLVPSIFPQCQSLSKFIGITWYGAWNVKPVEKYICAIG